MKLYILTVVLIFASCGGISTEPRAAEKNYTTYNKKEVFYQDLWCKTKTNFVETEKRIKGGRVDCVLDNYAIEFGFANKWKEDIAQARWYSHVLKKPAGIVMIFKKPSDIRYYDYAKEYLKAYCSRPVKIWILKDYKMN